MSGYRPPWPRPRQNTILCEGLPDLEVSGLEAVATHRLFDWGERTDSREAAAYLVQLARAIDLGRLAEVCPVGSGDLANKIQSSWFSG